MASKFNNKTLLIVLAALAVIYVVSTFLRKQSRTKTTLKTDIVNVDTAAVTQFTIHKENPITFSRAGNNWQVSSGGVTDDANTNLVQNVLSTLMSIKAERLVAKSSDKWAEYNLSDSTATRVTVTEGDKGQSLDLYIGRFNYQPPPQGQNQFQQRQQGISGSTYIRLGEGEEVYSTEGFLTMTFSQDFNSWRQTQFLKTTKSAITRVQFDYPADSSFVLTKMDSVWLVNDAPANQEAVDQYLSELTYKQDPNFADDFSAVGSPSHTLTIVGDNMDNIVVKAFANHDGNEYFIQSSMNPGATFRSARDGVYGDLFPGKEEFLE